MGHARSMILRPILVLLILIVPAAVGAPMELQEMLARAVETDARLRSLSGLLANTLLAIEKAKLAPGFQLQLSTGQARMGYSFNPASGEPPWIVSAEPSGVLVLGRRTETEVSATVPFAVAFGGGQAPDAAAAPKISVRQPLDKLFGGEKLTRVQDLETLLAAEKARVDVLNRVVEVERAVLGQLSASAGLERARGQIAHDLSRARAALDQVNQLGTYFEGSTQLRQMELAVSRLQRESEINGLRRGNAQRELERLVGETIESPPGAFPDPVLELPAAGDAERSPAVHLARLAVDLQQARLDEQRGPAKPRFYLGGFVNNARNELRDRRETTVAGAVEGEFEDVRLSAGIGGVVETGTLFVSAGLSWSLPDRKIEALSLKERENALEASRWDLAEARQAYEGALELLSMEVDDLALRRRGLEEDRALADLRLTEAARWLEQGLVPAEEVDELRWERDRLEHAFRVLHLDGLLLQSRIEALAAQDGDRP